MTKLGALLAGVSQLTRVPTNVRLDGLGSPEVILRFFCQSVVVTLLFGELFGFASSAFASALVAFLVLTLSEIFGETREVSGDNPFRGNPLRRTIALVLCALASLFIIFVVIAAAIATCVEPSLSLVTIIPLYAFAYVGGIWIAELNVRVLRFARAG
jgi:hypothetical protein